MESLDFPAWRQPPNNSFDTVPLSNTPEPAASGPPPAHSTYTSDARRRYVASSATAGGSTASPRAGGGATSEMEESLRISRERLRRKRLRESREKGGGFSFQYDTRIAALFIPCAFLMFAFGGKTLLGVCIVGLIIVYLLDALHLPDISFGAFWVTISATIIALWLVGVSALKSSVFSVFLLNNFTFFIILGGCWGSLHFRMFQEEFADLAIMMEQVLFSSLCMPVTAILTWGVVSVGGISNAPYFLIPIMYFAMKMTIMPTPSSHQAHAHLALKDKSEDQPTTASSSFEGVVFIVGSVVTSMHILVFALLPAVFYIIIHHRVIFTTLALSNVTVLVCLPLLLLLFLSSKSALDSESHSPTGIFWFVPISSESAEALYPTLVTLLLSLLTAALEFRVVLVAFTPYIALYQANPIAAVFLITAGKSLVVLCFVFVRFFLVFFVPFHYVLTDLHTSLLIHLLADFAYFLTDSLTSFLSFLASFRSSSFLPY